MCPGIDTFTLIGGNATFNTNLIFSYSFFLFSISLYIDLLFPSFTCYLCMISIRKLFTIKNKKKYESVAMEVVCRFAILFSSF